MRLSRPRYCPDCRATTTLGWFEDVQCFGLSHGCDWRARSLALEETLRQLVTVVEGVMPTPESRLDVVGLGILERARLLVGPPRQKR